MAYPHPTALAFDVSNNNGAGFSVSQAKLHNPDLKVLFAKIGEGETFADPDFATFFRQAVDLGLVCAPYFFARPETQPGDAGGVAEATRTLKLYAPFAGRAGAGIPVLDYESVRDPAFAAGFVRTIARSLSRGKPVVYCSASRVPELRTLASSVVFWIADYDVSALPALGVTVGLWQFTDRGVAYPGVVCDASHVYVNPADLLLRGKQPFYLDASVYRGKRFAHIRYGSGRVRAFMRSPGILRRLAAGKRVILRRRKGVA